MIQNPDNAGKVHSWSNATNQPLLYYVALTLQIKSVSSFQHVSLLSAHCPTLLQHRHVCHIQSLLIS